MTRLTRILGSVVRALATVVVTMVVIMCVAIAEIMAFGLFVARKADALGLGLTKMAAFLGVQAVAFLIVRWLAPGKHTPQGARSADQNPAP